MKDNKSVCNNAIGVVVDYVEAINKEPILAIKMEDGTYYEMKKAQQFGQNKQKIDIKKYKQIYKKYTEFL
jgi:hypothetical protein